VTTKVRYPDFSIRSRSTTRRTASRTPSEIGDLAARSSTRALTDRPGALRLVGRQRVESSRRTSSSAARGEI
jgi:hypothetical protein